MKITPSLFHAYIKCPTKCWLKFTGELPSGNPYATWMLCQNEAYRHAAIERLRSEVLQDECAFAPPPETIKTSKWRLGFDVGVTFQNLETRLHAIERILPESRGQFARLLPIRFVFTNKLGKDEKLLLAFDAFMLSSVLGREVSLGKIVHGDNHATLKVKTSTPVADARKLLDKIAALVSSPTPPDLVLNRHCGECEFRDGCRKKAIEKDDLSLLSSMAAKERKEYNSKGIFTVTQLSYTFRPRRRPKKLRDKREKYHHSLKALAVREKKIHIVGNPAPKLEGTPVYLDVEGLPDRDFYYLIGLRVASGEGVLHHCLWAERPDDEKRIWTEFLRIISEINKPILIHYGSYETTFLKQMAKRHVGPSEGTVAANAINSAVNLLSIIYSQVYFPTYSNGLKDIAQSLGFNWSEANSSGLQAICWHDEWERTKAAVFKERLVAYNADDCAALEVVYRAILDLNAPVEGVKGREIVSVDDAQSSSGLWKKFSSPIPAFEVANDAARWDYQRDRIYIRTDKAISRTARRSKILSPRSLRPNKEATQEDSRACPECGKPGQIRCMATRILCDIRFTRDGVRRWVVKYRFCRRRCPRCFKYFGRPKEFRTKSPYGQNVTALVIYMLIDLGMTHNAVAKALDRLFNLGIQDGDVSRFKRTGAESYAVTRQQILIRMLEGTFIHADETSIVVEGQRTYVWVFATIHEVVYFYAETREASFLQAALKGFKGVLVSDFYAAYDSIPCPQQKCLIHLMRDLNDAILEYPFDEELKTLVVSFSDLLKGILETIDRRGLKRHFLRKHRSDVAKFYRGISKKDYQSDAALKCRERFDKNREKLFTFLDQDGVPWNNNNAEHAIKAFARLRRGIEGLTTAKGIEEYLILLSVCQTCNYRGLDFLDFLRSGETDIQPFAKKQPNRRSAKRSPLAAC